MSLNRKAVSGLLLAPKDDSLKALVKLSEHQLVNSLNQFLGIVNNTYLDGIALFWRLEAQADAESIRVVMGVSEPSFSKYLVISCISCIT